MRKLILLKFIVLLAFFFLLPHYYSKALAFDASDSFFWSVCEYSDWPFDPCQTPYAGHEFAATLHDVILDPEERLIVDMGDGTIINSQTAIHSYEAPGEYLLSFIVVDDISMQQTTILTKDIHVIPVIPGTAEVDMSLTAIDNTTITYDLDLSLYAGSPLWTNEEATCEIIVDYGDGTDNHNALWVGYGGFFDMEAITHTYQIPGTYDAILSVNCQGVEVPYPDPSSTIVKRITVGYIVYEDLTSWDVLNGIEVVSVGDDQYQLTHPGSDWPILRKTLPAMSPGAQLKVSFKGQSDPAGSRLQIKPWDLARTAGGHIYLTEQEQNYTQTFTNLTGDIIAAPQLMFMFEDSSQTGIGQMITIDQLTVEILTEEQRIMPTDDDNNRAMLDGLLAVSKWEHAFFRFDLADVTGDVASASLRVYHYGSRIPLTLSVTAAETDDWSEAVTTPDLTYIHLQPDALIDSVNVSTTGYTELNVSDFIQSELNGDGIASLELSTDLKTWTLLGSKEGEYPPELIIKTGEEIDQVTRINVSSEGEESVGSGYLSGISSSERYVLFESISDDLVEGDNNERNDSFLRDMDQGVTTRINTTLDGTEIDGIWNSVISGNGRYVAFTSQDDNLVENDTYLSFDLFVLDRDTNRVEKASISSTGVAGNNTSYALSFSEDGRFLMFDSSSSNLVENDFNGTQDVFVHDRETKETTIVSVSTEGQPANSTVWGGNMSADGRYVVFASRASNLVAGDMNETMDVFLHDRVTGSTQLISVSSDGVQGLRSSSSPVISKDGNFVAFISVSNDLVGDENNSTFNIFVRDVQAGTTIRVSNSSTTEGGNLDSQRPHISDNGRFIAFQSRATNLVFPNTNHTEDVFVHDQDSGKTIMVAADASAPIISGDGKHVYFNSRNNYLVADDFNETSDVFVAPVNFD